MSHQLQKLRINNVMEKQFKSIVLLKLILLIYSKINSIKWGKLPMSTSSITQSCDSKNVFKGPKKKLKYINDKSVSHKVMMLERLTRVFADHND